MARKKVKYEVTLQKHGIMEGDTQEDIQKEVQRQADYQFYQSADSCEIKILEVVDLD